MKKLIVLCVMLQFLSCNQKTLSTTEVSEGISQMSIHLFDLPDGISEEEYLSDIEKLNSFYTDSGLKKNYTVLKVGDKSDVSEYKYVLVSSYRSAEEYESTHNLGEEYEAYMEYIFEKYEEMISEEIYRKVYTLN